MFNAQSKEPENYPSQSVQPEAELVSINSLLQKANAEYMDILYNVEDKLHSILNLRTPDKQPATEPQPKSINDFVGSIHEQFQVYRNQNGRLQKALDHLKRII